jgi:hypothetical protein
MAAATGASASLRIAAGRAGQGAVWARGGRGAMPVTTASENEAAVDSVQLWGRRFTTVQVALGIIALLTLFRLWYSTHLGLVADEAYYWVWSKHLALSYRDKGPVIAWSVALGTLIFGDTVFGIRWLGVFMAAGTGWQLFRLGRRLYDGRVGLWCLGVAAIMPLFGVGSILMTIDSPSMLCWAWGLNLAWTAKETGKLRHWLALGLVIGVGFMAKFTNGVQLACVALFLLWSQPNRKFIFSRQTVLMGIMFVLCTVPMIYWNTQAGWQQAQALHSRSGVEGSFHIRPLELLRFLGEQAGVISPLLAIGIAVAAFGMFKRHRDDDRVRFLLSNFVPLQAIFIFFSLNKAGLSNWPAPSLLSGMVLTVVYWREVVSAHPKWRHGVAWALGTALVMTAVLHNTSFLHLPQKLDPLHRAQGWADFANHIQRAREKYQPDFLMGNHYSQASLMRFYLPDRPNTYCPVAMEPQFDLWPGYKVKQGTRALFVSDDTNLFGPLQIQFNSWKLVDDFWSLHQGRPMNRYYIYLVERN